MYINVQAIVLRSEKVSERDRRVSILTRERGRLTVRASGVSRWGSKLAAAVEPAVEARFRLWLPGDRALGRITGGGLVTGFPFLRRRWEAMTSGLFFCEWTDRLTPLGETDPDAYDLLRRALGALETADAAAVRLAFLAQSVFLSGYGSGLGRWGGETEDARMADLFLTWDFASAAPEIPPARVAALEEQLVQFMTPLMHRPLKSLIQARSLKTFLQKRTKETVPL